MVLPRYIVLRNAENNHLSCLPGGGSSKYDLKFSEAEVLSPNVKFEVEPSTHGDGSVHIRSCFNNKYWTRFSTNWVVPTAEKKDEDNSKDSCTLFNFLPVNPAEGTFGIMHAQSGYHLCLGNEDLSTISSDGSVLCFHKSSPGPRFNVFTVIDWSSFVFLPRYVAFKAFNGKYLLDGYPQVITRGSPIMAMDTEIGANGVACEIVPTNDGNVRIMTRSSKNYWSQDLGNIIATLPFGTIDPKYTVFQPVKVDGNIIALKSVANQMFCLLPPMDADLFLIAAGLYVDNYCRITVEEPVLNREISDSRYDVDRARIYNQRIINLTETSVRNPYETTRKMSMTLRYKDVKSRSWKRSHSEMLSVKASLEVTIPFIGKGGVEISAEVQKVEEWGKTEEASLELEIQHEVEVPPHTLATVTLIATIATADVPLSYTQTDTFYDGTVTTTQITDAYFTGSNYFNLTFDNKEEPLPQDEIMSGTVIPSGSN